LIVLRRRLHGRVRVTNHDRWFFIQLYRWFPSILQVLTIIQPETLVRWHVEQGCADVTRRRDSWTRYLPSNPGRTAPSICPDLICGRHRFEPHCVASQARAVVLVDVRC
jgi:hypothetical protein